MGDDISSGLSSMAICFDFRSTNVVQLSNRNPHFYRFRCHHPLITQLNEHYWHFVFGILYLIFWLITLHSLLHFTSKFRKRSFMSITLFACFLKINSVFYRYSDYLQTQIHWILLKLLFENTIPYPTFWMVKKLEIIPNKTMM